MSNSHEWMNMSFSELWSPGMILFIILIATLYLFIVDQKENHLFDKSPVSTGKKVLFLSGLLIIYISLGSPLNFLGHHFLFSAHMIQQSLLLFVAPPLILLGTPAWVVRPILRWRAVRVFFVNPWISVIIFNLLLSLYHFPIIFDASLKNHILGSAFHITLFITSFLMWWGITCPIPEFDLLSGLKKMAYIVVNALLLYPACVIIIFSKNLLYTSYLEAPQIIDLFSQQDDQQLGGIIMKIMQEGVQIVALAWIFRQWYRLENKEEPLVETAQSNHLQH